MQQPLDTPTIIVGVVIAVLFLSIPVLLVVAEFLFPAGGTAKDTAAAATTIPASTTPAIARSEIDALKARLLGLVNRRDEELEALADSNEPAEVKEEKARALLERYNRDIAEA